MTAFFKPTPRQAAKVITAFVPMLMCGTALGQRLEEFVSSRDNFEWVEQSGWMERLCRIVEDSRGGGYTTEICLAVTR